MSDEEFLKRWLRRKQEARTASEAPPTSPPADMPPPDAQVAASEPEIDLSKLPPLDSITTATDITEFLRKGIPAELSRAALRRAWAADPAIRDFVGLAENAWDFTDPNAIPGFGPLHGSPEQIGAMVERVLGGVRDAADKLTSGLPEGERGDATADRERNVSAAAPPPSDAVINATLPSDNSAEAVAAAQPEASGEEDDDVPVRRRMHGGALPR